MLHVCMLEGECCCVLLFVWAGRSDGWRGSQQAHLGDEAGHQRSTDMGQLHFLQVLIGTGMCTDGALAVKSYFPGERLVGCCFAVCAQV